MSTASTQSAVTFDMDRLRDALSRAQERRMLALHRAIDDARRVTRREWFSFDWDASELVENT